MKNKKPIWCVGRTPFKTQYNTNSSKLVTVWAGVRGDSLDTKHHTEFDDDAGGLRLLTEEEVQHLVASENEAAGWKQGETESDGTPILTYGQ